MKTREFPLQLIAAGIVALTVWGCKQDEATPTTPAGGGSATAASSDKKPVKLAFVTNGTSDFWAIANKGIEKAKSEDPSIQVDFRDLPNGTPAEQKEALDDLLVKGIEGIAISVRDPANETDMINAAAKKAMIFTTDSDAATSDRVCYVGTNNVDAGKQAGEEIKKAIPGGGKIMLFVGLKDAANAKERIGGIEEALKGSNVSVIDVRTDDNDRGRAVANVSDTMVKYPDVACLVGIYSYNGPAIYTAVKAANKLGKVKIVCFDEQDETLAGVKEGSISATIVQQPFEFGYESIKFLAKAIRGDKSDIPANKLKYVPTTVITKDTVDAFWDNLKKETGKA
ncbi:MAG: sugar-binding protein [Fimbriimonas sp.]|nr:sugar-binding protein [Fimbriimonas sp.]